MWAVPQGSDRYRIDNIPFYARGVSDGDVVEAHFVEDFGLRFEAVVEPSEFSTLRIAVASDDDKQPARDHFKLIGCDSEGMNGNFFALSIPRASLNSAMDAVRVGEAAGRWDWEERIIRT